MLLTGGTRRGVACWVEAQVTGAASGPNWGPGPMLPSALLPVLVLTRDWVGRLISIELGDKLAPRGLMGLVGTGGGVVPGGGALSCLRPPLPWPFFAALQVLAEWSHSFLAVFKLLEAAYVEVPWVA